MTDDWDIEGEFRDGSERVRDADGQYQSVSTAILDEVSEFEVFSEGEIASRIDVDETVALEHLLHLKKKGLVEGREGEWSKAIENRENEIPDANEHAFEWNSQNGDDALY